MLEFSETLKKYERPQLKKSTQKRHQILSYETICDHGGVVVLQSHIRFASGSVPRWAFCIIKMAKTPNFGVRKIAIIEFTEGNKICHFVGTFAYNPIV